MSYSKYTKERLQEAANASNSVMGVMRFLGLSPVGGNHSYMTKRLKALEVDTSHFTGQAWSKNTVSKQRISAEKRLVLREPHSGRAKTSVLRKALLSLGRAQFCVDCGVGTQYNNKPLVLEIDHLNNLHWDDRPENLQFLCPNCHSQK